MPVQYSEQDACNLPGWKDLYGGRDVNHSPRKKNYHNALFHMSQEITQMVNFALDQQPSHVKELATEEQTNETRLPGLSW